MSEGIFLGQGAMVGEVTESSALLQTRLTASMELSDQGDLEGASGVACFLWSEREDFVGARRTFLGEALAESDFIVKWELIGLKANTEYFYRVLYGEDDESLREGPVGSFRTLAGKSIDRQARFIVGSCMNYNKFLHGRAGNAGGPLTATEEDKRLGFPAFEAMGALAPDFFVGTGDIVYYDNPYRISRSVEELRLCWHEQFRFPRMIEFFRRTPTYWSKDDHDFRYNDSDNTSSRLPLSDTGIEMFIEQLPIGSSGTYRTHRVSRDLQVWLTEGRDYRSANEMPDGPGKTMWGLEQLQWLKATLVGSDAKWKLLISPTPLVGPDMSKKNDNHAIPGGFKYEADAFFKWLKEARIQNFYIVCGDRHWQYHSIHPSGIEEFGCGALNDENSRLGVVPGGPGSSDPEGLIVQKYTSPTPSGGFLQVTASGDELAFEMFDSRGKQLYFARF
ncbi:MAG: alkaline phosphatase D family protein [Verrucomicrobiota bacterium]